MTGWLGGHDGVKAFSSVPLHALYSLFLHESSVFAQTPVLYSLDYSVGLESRLTRPPTVVHAVIIIGLD